MRLVVAAAVLGLVGLSGCMSAEQRERASMTAEPVDGWPDTRNVSRAGEVTFSGQPSEAALGQFADGGGAMVIDLRTHNDGDGASFDEEGLVEGRGMHYVSIPFSSAGFSAADVDKFAMAMRSADGPVLVHCGSSNRVGGMWAAYLAREQGWETDAAIEAGKAAGMRSESVEEAARRVIAE